MKPNIHDPARTLTQPQRLSFTRIEAARQLGISPASLDRAVARGLLHPSRAFRRPLYTVEELQRFLSATSPNL